MRLAVVVVAGAELYPVTFPSRDRSTNSGKSGISSKLLPSFPSFRLASTQLLQIRHTLDRLCVGSSTGTIKPFSTRNSRPPARKSKVCCTQGGFDSVDDAKDTEH